jgi:hypothetical protein
MNFFYFDGEYNGEYDENKLRVNGWETCPVERSLGVCLGGGEGRG